MRNHSKGYLDLKMCLEPWTFLQEVEDQVIILFQQQNKFTTSAKETPTVTEPRHVHAATVSFTWWVEIAMEKHITTFGVWNLFTQGQALSCLEEIISYIKVVNLTLRTIPNICKIHYKALQCIQTDQILKRLAPIAQSVESMYCSYSVLQFHPLKKAIHSNVFDQNNNYFWPKQCTAVATIKGVNME